MTPPETFKTINQRHVYIYIYIAPQSKRCMVSAGTTRTVQSGYRRDRCTVDPARFIQKM